MSTLATCLWFDDQAEPAACFYTSIFENSHIRQIAHYGDNAPRPEGTVMTVNFEIEGHEFIALNGGPQYTITPAVSFVVNCDTQEQIDYYWEKLSAGGTQIQCGWLTDKFGVSWQIVPRMLLQWMKDPDTTRTNRLMQALWKMVKLDIAELQRAYEGK